MSNPDRFPKISILKRRREYLENFGVGKWDRAEKNALDWALNCLETHNLSDDHRITCPDCGFKSSPDRESHFCSATKGKVPNR